MKNLLFILVAITLTTVTFAQKVKEENVPSIIRTAFQKQYPAVKNVQWEKEAANYEAEFEIDDIDQSVLLDAEGNIIETEIEIEVSSLPENARNYISKNYPGKKIKEAAKITSAKGVITHEAEVKGKDLIFDSTGNFIK